MPELIRARERRKIGIMAEFLSCYQNCGPANGGIRPCARQVFNSPDGDCAKRILSNPKVRKLHPTGVNTTMDGLINHEATVVIEIKKGNFTVQRPVARIVAGEVIPVAK